MEVPALAAGSGGRGCRPERRSRRTAFVPRLRWVRTNAWNDGIAMNTPSADAVREATAQLDALSVDLAERGFETHMMADRHTLSVANRTVPEIREDIEAAPADDGVWWFCWSWGDRITPVTDVATAAFKIAYVLTPTQI